jgi:creatinine amidohydrolase
MTLHNVIKDVCNCLIYHGFRNIFFLNGHGGNLASLYLALNEVYDENKEKIRLQIAAPDWFPTMYETYGKVATSEHDPESDFHQGERETSFTLAARPELVDMSKAETHFSDEIDRKKNLYGWAVNLPYLLDYDIKTTTPVGYIGDAKVASKEVGNLLYEACSDFIATFIKNEHKPRK